MKNIFAVVFFSVFFRFGFGQTIGTEVLNYHNGCAYPETFAGISVKTKIPFEFGVMGNIKIEGYNYGLQKNIDWQITYYSYKSSATGPWYFYSGNISTSGSYNPEVKLYNEGGFVCIFIPRGTDSQYCINFRARAWNSLSGDSPTWYQNWSANVISTDPTTTLVNENKITLVYKNSFQGNVGIGTDNPGFKLDVNGHTNISAGNNLYMGGKLTLSKGPTYQTINDTDGRNAIYLGGTIDKTNYYDNNNHYFRSIDVTKTNMAIIGDKIGIGTSSPAYQFHVNTTAGAEKIISAYRMSGGIKNPGLFFSADETTGISAIHFSGSAGYQGRLRVGNTDVMSLISDGSVGFGSGNPSSVGNLRILTTGASPIANRITYGTDNTGWKFAISKNYQGTLTDQFVLQDNGNIGIGTTIPQNKLEIAGALNSSGLRFTNLKSTTTVSPSNNKALSVDANGDVILVNSTSSTPIDSTVRKNIYFQSDGGSILASQKLSVLNNGNIGIGTNTPSQKLELANSGDVGLRLFNMTANTWDIKNTNLGKLDFIRGGDKLHMRIDQSGNVGIGGDPISKFNVNYSTSFNVDNPNSFYGIHLIPSSTTPGHASGITFGSVDGMQSKSHAGLFVTSGGSFGTRMYFATTDDYSMGSKTRMMINANGNIGIGTNNPISKLQIATLVNQNQMTLGSSTGVAFSITKGEEGYGLYSGISGTGDTWIQGGRTNAAIAYNLLFQNAGGNVGIGTTTPKAKLDVNGTVAIGFVSTLAYPAGYKLAVDGNIIAEKIKVKNSDSWPDFVFKKDYKLPSLSDIEKYVNQNSHLPEIPSAAEVEKDGQDLGEMNRLLLKKVEELTLYLIQQEKKSNIQEQKIKILEAQNSEILELKKQIATIKTLLEK